MATEDWRKANVTTVFKKCKKHDARNYRLVSLTLVPWKVVKQLILETKEGKKMIRSNQHGFAKGKSCLTNVINFYSEMTGR